MNLGMPEMIFIFLLALVIFGPKKLPELGREVGKALAEFKRASNDFKNQLENEIDQLDVEKQRDYYRSRAEQLAREAQEAFSIKPPESPGSPTSEPTAQGRSFDVEGYPPTTPVSKPEDVPPNTVAESQAPDSLKGTNA
jgi:TatA/E family protein of Tat protein translocase